MVDLVGQVTALASRVATEIKAVRATIASSWAKQDVRAVATASIALTGTKTVDGVALVAGDRVLVTAQSAPATNGIYLVSGGSWTRATDADSPAKLAGAVVTVSGGTNYGGSKWTTAFKDTDLLGTTAMTWIPVLRDDPYLYLSPASPAIPTGVWTKVTGLTLVEASAAADFTVASGNITVTVAGRYNIAVELSYAANTTGRRLVRISLNGTVIQQSGQMAFTTGTSRSPAVMAFDQRLAAGDVLMVEGFQDSGFATALAIVDPSSILNIRRVGS